LQLILCSVAGANQPLDFIALNMKGSKVTKNQWSPLVDYLAFTLNRPVELKILKNSNYVKRSVNGSILLTNPVNAVIIEDGGDFEIIATMNQKKQGSRFAGVIITRKDSLVKNISDLVGRRVGVVNKTFAAGGFLFQSNELLRRGIDPMNADITFRELFNQKAIIKHVASGELDAGFIKTGMLESYSDRKAVAKLRIVNKMIDGLPYARSTAIYPNWAVLVRKNLPQDVKNRIVDVLLSLKENTHIATRAGIKGFVARRDYDAIKQVMNNLGTYQFKNIQTIPRH